MSEENDRLTQLENRMATLEGALRAVLTMGMHEQMTALRDELGKIKQALAELRAG